MAKMGVSSVCMLNNPTKDKPITVLICKTQKTNSLGSV